MARRDECWTDSESLGQVSVKLPITGDGLCIKATVLKVLISNFVAHTVTAKDVTTSLHNKSTVYKYSSHAQITVHIWIYSLGVMLKDPYSRPHNFRVNINKRAHCRLFNATACLTAKKSH